MRQGQFIGCISWVAIEEGAVGSRDSAIFRCADLSEVMQVRESESQSTCSEGEPRKGWGEPSVSAEGCSCWHQVTPSYIFPH